MPLSHRIERISEQLREEVSQILATDVVDPGVGLVTVSRVKVSPDLSLARVYWTLIGTTAERMRTTKAWIALSANNPYNMHDMPSGTTASKVLPTSSNVCAPKRELSKPETLISNESGAERVAVCGEWRKTTTLDSSARRPRIVTFHLSGADPAT